MRSIDWLLLLVCGLLLVAGPAMALQEWTRFEQQAGLAKVTGEAPALEPAFRSSWRAALLAAVIVGGLLGTILAMRIARQPKVRAVSGRLLLILLSGMVALDLTFLADGRWFVGAPYAIRGATIVWMYPLAAVLIGGAVMRLSEVEDAFADRPAHH